MSKRESQLDLRAAARTPPAERRRRRKPQLSNLAEEEDDDQGGNDNGEQKKEGGSSLKRLTLNSLGRTMAGPDGYKTLFDDEEGVGDDEAPGAFKQPEVSRELALPIE